MTRRLLIPIAIAASLVASVAVASVGAGGAVAGDVGVIVETTRGPDLAAVRAARADVARLRRDGRHAELRVTRSPSESLAAAAALVTRGATVLVTREVDERAVLAPLQRAHPGLRIARRP